MSLQIPSSRRRRFSTATRSSVILPYFHRNRIHPKFNPTPADPNVVENVTDSDLQVGLLIPTANQMCAVIHSPAGDLHTPNVGWNLASTPSVWDRMGNVQLDV
jgi:hypothetical protein